MRRRSSTCMGLLAAASLMAAGCTTRDEKPRPAAPPAKAPLAEPSKGPPATPWHAEPPPVAETMAQPVPLWEGGKVSKQVDAATASAAGYVVLDLGEDLGAVHLHRWCVRRRQAVAQRLP